MKLAIVGWRNFTDKKLLYHHVDAFCDEHGTPEQVISGGARGADTLAEQWAEDKKIKLLVLKPDWHLHDKAAGPMRNDDIVKECTHMIAFPSEKGRGTQDAIRKAKKAGKIIKVIKI